MRKAIFLLILVLAFMVPQVFAETRYRVSQVDVDSSLFLNQSFNNLGQLGAINSLAHPSIVERSGLVRDIHTLGSGIYSTLEALNDRGEAAGALYSISGDAVGVYRYTRLHGMTNLGLPFEGDVSNIFVSSLNSRGALLTQANIEVEPGTEIVSSACIGCPQISEMPHFMASSINDRFQIVGRMSDGRAMLIGANGVWRDISGNLGQNPWARRINNRGVVMGDIFEPTSSGNIVRRTVLWSSNSGDRRVVPGLGNRDSSSTYLHSMNNSNIAVGLSAAAESDFSNLKAVRWDPANGLRDLNTMLVGEGNVDLESAVAINDRGEILINNGAFSHPRYYLLQPVSQ